MPLHDPHFLQEAGFISMDVFENETDIFVEMELAGVDPKDFTVSVQKKHLVVEGVKREPLARGPVSAFHCAERNFGGFKREFEIGAAVDERRIEASLKNGILLLRLPKLSERRENKHFIKVRVDE